MKMITTIFYFIYIITYLNIFLRSPGIAGREYYANTFRFKKEEDKLNYQICDKCNIIIPKSFRVIHCGYCNICIIKHHHHCPWTGKCIGKNNLRIFCVFGCSLFFYIISLITSFITCILFISDNKEANKLS